MDDAAVGELRRRHAPAVLANRVVAARGWGKPYRAYHACVRPGPREVAGLSAIQDRVLAAEPRLLRVPGPAMHTNVAWLLPGHQEFGRPKEEIWRERGQEWMEVLTATARGMCLRYRALVATDTAIIAVADEPNGVSALRRRLSRVLDVPGGLAAGSLVHITLFRYPGPLRDPAHLLRLLADHSAPVEQEARELLVVRERVFPSLEYDVVHRIGLRPADE